jgi:putative ABC transport system permease protein
MRPPAPVRYHTTAVDRFGLSRFAPQLLVMVLREVSRRPLRAALSSIGIALAIAIFVLGRFSADSVATFMDVLFARQQREDMTVTLMQPAGQRAVQAVARLPGVLAAEGMRVIPVRVSHQGRSRDIALYGLPERGALRQVVDGLGRSIPRPASGLMLTRKLAEVLGVGPDAPVALEIREGRRRRVLVPVTVLADEAVGLQAYMRSSDLDRMLGEEPAVSLVLARIVPGAEEDLRRRLERSPWVAAVDSKRLQIRWFWEQTGRSMGITTLVMTVFAAAIAAGVVYNNARVTLSARARDLASLRVLGFTRREISTVLLSEMAVHTAIAIPVGLLLGRWWADALLASTDPELFRMAAVVSGRTLLAAVAVTVLASVAAALWVRRRLDHLDLMAVLKERE